MHRLDQTPYKYAQVAFLEKIVPATQHIWREYEAGDIAVVKSEGRFGDVFSLFVGSTNWMNTNPIDYLDHAKILNDFAGNVLLTGMGLGLGLVYCSMNPEVRSVTVCEKDRRIIELAHALVVPHIRHIRSGLHVKYVEGDATNYELVGRFDCAFLDHAEAKIAEGVVDGYRSKCAHVVEWWVEANEVAAAWR